MYCWEAAIRSQAAITELLLFRKSTGAILRDALPALQRLCTNGPLEVCQVRMFVKQPNRQLQQLLAVENKIILQQLRPSTLYMMFQLTLIFYPHHTGMRSEMFILTGHLKSAKNECFWRSVEKTAEAFICCRKKYLYSSKKRSNLYMISFNSVKKFLSNYLCTLLTNVLH